MNAIPSELHNIKINNNTKISYNVSSILPLYFALFCLSQTQFVVEFLDNELTCPPHHILIYHKTIQQTLLLHEYNKQRT